MMDIHFRVVGVVGTVSLTLVAALSIPMSGRAETPVRIASKVSGHIHPALCVGKTGTVVIVFSQSDMKDLRVTRSIDGGKTFSEPVAFAATEKVSIYPGSLTTLKDGRIVHAWNVWYMNDENKKSRFVQYSVSDDDGKTWGEPQSLAKNAKAESIIRHPFVELEDGRWLLSLNDRTVTLDPKTGEEKPFGTKMHGLVPLVRTSEGAFVAGGGWRSDDQGKTWKAVTPFPKIGANGWRFDLAALPNGWLVAGEVLGEGVGGDSWRFVISRDGGKTWDFGSTKEFYKPGRPIGGRACPKSVQLDGETLGTVFYDVDAKQKDGPGVFFLRTPLASLAPKKP